MSDDLDELPDDIAALLREGRGDAPAPASERRKVAARLAITTGLIVPSATFAGSKLLGGVWALRGLGVLAALTLGGLAVGTLRAQRPPPPAHTVPSMSPPRAPEPVRTSPPALTAVPPGPIAMPPAPPLPTSPRPVPATVSRLTPMTRATVDHALDAELALVDGARRLLAHGDGDGAAAMLVTHARRHPRGVLVPEREALRVECLAAQGDQRAAAEARARFHRRFPGSVLGPAVDRAVDERP